MTDPVSPTLAPISLPQPNPAGEKTEIILPPVVPIISTPGRSSSEFLMTLLQSILPAAATICGILMDVLPNFGTPGAAQTLIVVGVAAKVLMALGYQVNRTAVKLSEAAANSVVQQTSITAASYANQGK